MADRLQPFGLKLAIRTDAKAGVIRAYFADMDDRGDRLEVSTLSLRVADEDRAAFDAWKDGLAAALNRLIERMTGTQVVQNVEFRPHDKN